MLILTERGGRVSDTSVRVRMSRVIIWVLIKKKPYRTQLVVDSVFILLLLLLFYILLTVHLDAILGNDQLDALFLNVFIYASTCFEQQVFIIRRAKLC
jgi:hypothetical protein